MAKYFINQDQVNEEIFKEEYEKAIRYEAEDTFDDYIDESSEPVEIYRMTYPASRVLKECDPTAYRCMLNDYEDQVRSDKADSLEMFLEVEVNGDTFTIEEEEEEEE